MNNFEIEIIPTEGITFGGTRILLGNSKAKVEAALGAPERVKNSFYYFDNELRFDFDGDGKVEFIEFLGGIDGNLKPRIYGISAFDSLDDVLYGTLLEHNGKEIINNENGHGYSFCNISVGIWREMTRRDIEETLSEMKQEGIPFEEYRELENDKRKAFHWATVGIGRKGYYNG